ncbi:helix-turn-helix transcriptional regulator [Veillonella parvula]|uniref:helix-turn-helix domain-containing protein n=1 Tax=Veillonella parvula TaxID=29466 RepID=UPI0028EDBAB1|nr:helix-turn-helix transcriptional regulator [Veillonella parvula]
MKYSYNKLWKMLIDRHTTKMQMRIETGISTNILAKMGKDEPIVMDGLAKIAAAL